MKPTNDRLRRTPRLVARFVAISWRDLAVSFGPILAVSAAAVWLAIRLIQPAPPDVLTISAGPPGSSFWNAAQRYKTILARNGITLHVITSEGSLQNLQRLSDPAVRVDVGFVQSGVVSLAAQPAGAGASGASGASAGASGASGASAGTSGTSGASAAAAASSGAGASGATAATAASSASDASGTPAERLVSLGSVAYVPLVVFYNGPIASRLSAFAGKRLAIGPEGSGTRALALALLKANGIEPGGATTLLPLAGEDAAAALTSHRIDVAFLTGDSAQPPVMARLTRTPGVRLLSFEQAEAYARRFPYLTVIELPMGSFDLGKNLPPQTVRTVASTAELIARDTLHPALSDLLIEAAREAHGGATLLQHAGEFPSPAVHDFPIGDDAARYYRSGKGFLYRVLPFWLASLADRLIVLIVPIVVVLIPGLRLVPSLYAWRVRSRIYRWYGALIAIERGALNDMSESERAALIEKLDEIEEAVNRMKMPLAYADQFYVLREHIGFVRARLASEREPLARAHARTHEQPGGA